MVTVMVRHLDMVMAVTTATMVLPIMAGTDTLKIIITATTGGTIVVNGGTTAVIMVTGAISLLRRGPLCMDSADPTLF